MPKRKWGNRCPSCTSNPSSRQYIAMWDTITKRKVAGFAAPCRLELPMHLRRYEHMVVYDGQDVRMAEKRLKDLNGKVYSSKGLPKYMKQDGESGLQTKRKLGTEKVSVARPRVVPLDKVHSTAKSPVSLPGMTKPSLRIATKERDQLTTKQRRKPFDLPQPFAAQPPRKSVILTHPHAYIALAQKVWESEAAHVRGLQEDSDDEIEQLKKIRTLRRWYR